MRLFPGCAASILSAAVLALWTCPLQADLYYEQVSSLKPVEQSGEASPAMRLRVYVRGRMLRAEDTASGKIVIARLDKGVIWGINEADKTYTELSLQEISDDWERARRSAGYSETSKASVTVEQSPTDEIVGGYNCRKFSLLQDGQTVMDVWNATTLNIPEKAALYEYTQALGEFPKPVIEKLRALPGFPMRMDAVKTIGAGKVESFREVVLIRLDPIDPKLFELPEGFKKIEVK